MSDTDGKIARTTARTAEEAKLVAGDAVGIDVLSRRAATFYEQGHLEAAYQLTLEIVTRHPGHIDSLMTLAHSLRDLGRFDESIAVLERVARIDRKHARAHAAYALALFYKEDWARAWRAFDVRFKLMDQPPIVTRSGPDGKPVPIPPWLKGPVPASVLVLGEQGLGDTIQFARFLPLLKEAGAQVTCVVQRRLFELLKTLDSDIAFRPIEEPGSVAGVKGWTPIMHLPRVLGLEPDKFIRRTPYLSAEPARVARWRKRLGDEGFKIGIVWQGNADPRIDLGRSAPLSAFAPLAEIPGVRLISLQHGNGVSQIPSVPFAGRVETLGDTFDAGPDGFLDTAAVMQCLDLFVTVDTSLAHVAGALGRPVFILLKRLGADWRWLFGRTDTVWYPSATLFRQTKPGDWSELLGRVAAEVRRRAPAAPLAPVSVGELLDKLTILEIKRERIDNPDRRAKVEAEYVTLAAVRAQHAWGGEAFDRLLAELKTVNETLWQIEDDVRECERKKTFGPKFVKLARAVYKNNDRRAAIKNELNSLCGSSLAEQKSYETY
jgi:Family of unknown function (DUF6165)/Tetratricopeptide repeat/Glycosyltransferase family 9 (heptosyltransferase)